MKQPIITVSMPCFGRPERTKRAIECIGNQNTGPWEAFIIGDGCTDFENLVQTAWMTDFIIKQNKAENKIIAFNYPNNLGGFGYFQTNHAIDSATGKYFVFMANDDFIHSHHFTYYLSQIENTDLDFVYFDSGYRKERHLSYKLKYGYIGHNALIIRTEFLKQMPRHSPRYGHDWTLIENMLRAGARYKKSVSTLTTYEIMTCPKNRIDPDGID